MDADGHDWLSLLGRHSAVHAVERRPLYRPTNLNARWVTQGRPAPIPSVDKLVGTKLGLTGSGQIIGVCDTGGRLQMHARVCTCRSYL